MIYHIWLLELELGLGLRFVIGMWKVVGDIIYDDLLSMMIYYLWRFIINDDLLSMTIYYLWRFIINDDLSMIDLSMIYLWFIYDLSMIYLWYISYAILGVVRVRVS